MSDGEGRHHVDDADAAAPEVVGAHPPAAPRQQGGGQQEHDEEQQVVGASAMCFTPNRTAAKNPCSAVAPWAGTVRVWDSQSMSPTVV